MPRQRNKHIAVKVTETEFIRLKERVNASGLTQTQYVIHALLYGRIIVTGTRENIDYILNRIAEMECRLQSMLNEIREGSVDATADGTQVLKREYTSMLRALLEIVREADIQVKK